MKYKKFLEHVYQRYSGNVKLGLERMNSILQEMGNPNTKLKGIHIAGTNGKGSTAAMCEAISIAQGLKTGLNTSPHLVDYRERLRVNGKKIIQKELMDTYREWEYVFEKNEASFFEITTAMAFYHFRKNNIQNAIFEVGLGGRLDGTNPFQSTVTVITSISRDHTKSLGRSITKIATEKAGILKQGIPLILGKVSYQAANIIESIAKERSVPIIKYGKDFTISNIRSRITGTWFDYNCAELQLKNIMTNLIGSHQAYNAALAITASKKLFELTGYEFREDLLRRGLRSVHWQGRLQLFQKNPYVLIDGAHNEEGVKTLLNSLSILFPDKKFIFVLAILRDKNLNLIFKRLTTASKKMYISKNKSNRAAEIADEEKYVKKYGGDYEIRDNVIEAARAAINNATRDDVIIITGSLYTISEILASPRTVFS
ncbi:MAG: bifunctional folylpolyglutamate synthase/dihydrofolate synthase [Candidatus Cloacimonetes bacterium]|nr:bifunctional folylpolyglutamate synthase/dihydrofolate synthase [Candidatus Cloacimonadota bacterium]